MSFRKKADNTTSAVAEALGAEPTPEQAKAVAELIERGSSIRTTTRPVATPRSPRIAARKTRTWRTRWPTKFAGPTSR